MLSRRLTSAALATMWLLALVVGVSAARYFLDPVPLLVRTQVLALARHPDWVLLHVSCGIAAIVAGPFVRGARRCLDCDVGRGVDSRAAAPICRPPRATLTFWSWVLNLTVAEWIVRRR